jgi:hypothetical protein
MANVISVSCVLNKNRLAPRVNKTIMIVSQNNERDWLSRITDSNTSGESLSGTASTLEGSDDSPLTSGVESSTSWFEEMSAPHMMHCLAPSGTTLSQEGQRDLPAACSGSGGLGD